MKLTKQKEEISIESNCNNCGMTIIDRDGGYQLCENCKKELRDKDLYCNGFENHYCKNCGDTIK